MQIHNRLNAGFFSNFNAVIDWAWVSKLTNIPIYIKWTGFEHPNINMFEYIFEQKFNYTTTDQIQNGYYRWSTKNCKEINQLRNETIPNLNTQFDGWYYCDGEVYNHPEFRNLQIQLNNAFYSFFKFKPNIQFPMADFSLKTLGIQYRFISTFIRKHDNEPLSKLLSVHEYDQLCLDHIERLYEDHSFEQIYLACDQQDFLNLCLQKFKDKLIFSDHARSAGINDWFSKISPTNDSLLDEWIYVLTDAINLSNCEYFVGSPSNVSFGILTMNPNLKFEIFPILKNMKTG